MRPELVTYDGLPASSGGAHRLRTRKPGTALAQVQSFLAACTLPDGPSRWAFELWSGGPEAATERWRAFAAERLGGPRRSGRTHREWSVHEQDVAAIMRALDTADPVEVTRHGQALARLTLTVPVCLRDPATGAPYSGVSADETGAFAVDGYGRMLGASGIRGTFATSGSTLSLWLSFPGDERLGPAVAAVRQACPVRPSATHWRRWVPTKNEAGYRSLKIQMPVSAPVSE
ncbi:hypothetical protein FM113_12490 [Leucobacter sp. 7(1)]|uniref:hypothetical protein n=1 Tax=Leucobacter sp. 7(1) TaxID=1255613 RepID=UPI00097F2743|nr:hypothetical protein [Leucobacter sp. 7(1)]SJN11612.1 hypothetical protein FM113_12490 [Leucobacter sp. 7(1)]